MILHIHKHRHNFPEIPFMQAYFYFGFLIANQKLPWSFYSVLTAKFKRLFILFFFFFSLQSCSVFIHCPSTLLEHLHTFYSLNQYKPQILHLLLLYNAYQTSAIFVISLFYFFFFFLVYLFQEKVKHFFILFFLMLSMNE